MNLADGGQPAERRLSSESHVQSSDFVPCRIRRVTIFSRDRPAPSPGVLDDTTFPPEPSVLIRQDPSSLAGESVFSKVVFGADSDQKEIE